MTAPSPIRRAAVFAASLLLFAGLGALVYRFLPPREAATVELADDREGFLANYEARRAESEPEPVEPPEATDPSLPEEKAPETAAPSPAAAVETSDGRQDPPPLVREELSRAQVEQFYPALRGNWVYRPDLWARRKPGLDNEVRFQEHPDGSYRLRTNAEGLRMNADILAEPPDLRVLVAGDSHAAGICNNEETFSAVLEELLRERLPGRSVEVVNAALGTYNFYNYLQVLEYFLHLDPDVFVVVPYAGNDFHASAQIARFFRRMEAPQLGPLQAEDLKGIKRGLVAQELSQVVYFANNPDDVALAEETAQSITVELESLCRSNDIAFLGALLPTGTFAQPDLFSFANEKLMRMIGLGMRDLRISVRLGKRWLAFLEQRDLPSMDLGPVLATERPNYWRSDLHVNVAGHRRIAEALLPRVLELIEE